jgi:hypothetical protein
MIRHLILILCLGGAFVLPGCVAETPTAGSISERLQSEDPAVRIQAAVEAGEKKDESVVPLLVERLTDTQADVRFFAALALEKITGKTLGWKPGLSEAEQMDVLEAWRKYVREHYGESDKTSPTESRPSESPGPTNDSTEPTEPT